MDLDELREGERVVSIVTGDYHCAAITSHGALLTWGRGEAGQLGRGDRSNASFPCRIESETMGKVVSVSCGAGHTAAISDKGALYLWGQGNSGQHAR